MAYDLEAARLLRQNRDPLSWQNRVLQGQAYSLAILAAAYGLAGLKGMFAFLVAALSRRIAHELINYVQHYGLVRLDDQPVEERHTWNCNRLISNALQYNLPRHADHHLRADRLFWQLKINSAAPTLPYGYQTMAMIALVPNSLAPIDRAAFGGMGSYEGVSALNEKLLRSVVGTSSASGRIFRAISRSRHKATVRTLALF